jgi:potassium-transporting ATPase KdpC subunit
MKNPSDALPNSSIVWISLKLFILFWIVVGGIYPLFLTMIANFSMPYQARGSLIVVDKKILGSALIGQSFQLPHHFWSRPSASDYNPLSSGNDNLGPTSQGLQQLFKKRQQHWLDTHSDPAFSKVPQNLLFASASGLDPHISPQAVQFQMSRVAQALKGTAINGQKLEELIQKYTEPPSIGILGESRINVLLLNQAIDSLLQGQKNEL